MRTRPHSADLLGAKLLKIETMGAHSGNAESPQISTSQVEELRSQLRDSTVLTPQSSEYHLALKRWSDAAEKDAVCDSSCNQ